MRKVKLYIASSIDGKIALPDGNIDWLNDFNNPDQDYGYKDFLDSVDITIMGNKTYQQVLSFGKEFPYRDKRNYVFTRNTGLIKDENVDFVSRDYLSFIHALKNETGKDIWLIGGSKVNSFFLANNLIDELILFIIPVLLGDGIPLFEKPGVLTEARLAGTKCYSNGVVELKYNFNNA